MAADMIGKASGEMLKELQNLQKQDQLGDKGGGKDSGAKFDKALQNHSQSQVNETQNLAKLQETQKATQATTVQATPKSALSQALTNQRTTEVKKSEHTAFNGVVREMMARQNKLEDLMKVAVSSQKLSNQEMIGIQAGVYMYSQQMELTSKVIEKATSGIKQTMNTQV